MRRLLIAAILILLAPCLSFAGTAQVRAMMGMWGAKAASEWTIDDNFDTNSASNYTLFSGTVTLVIDGGDSNVAKPEYASTGYFQHSTDLGSADMTVQGVICNVPASGNGTALVLRSNGTTAHGCYPDVNNNRFTCAALGGSGNSVYRSWTASAWASGACHLVEISTSGNTYTFKVDFNDDLDFSDTNEAVGTSANSDYSGTRAGIGFRAVTTTQYIDNFKAKAN